MEFNDNFSFTSKIKGSISSSEEKNIFDYLPYSEIKTILLIYTTIVALKV